MLFLYSIVTQIVQFSLPLFGFFSPKMKLFVNGRKTVFETLEQKINSSDKTIWFHAASLGEYEQGLPVMEKIKAKFPTAELVPVKFSLIN
jgi:3-deoxy-D-manno-octulosonic-acid transferase